MVVDPLDCIIGMRTITRICHWPQSLLFQAAVREGLPKAVLTKPYLAWHSILEANHIVLPILHEKVSPGYAKELGRGTDADMIINVLLKHLTAPVECVKVHIESIDLAVSTIIHNDGCASSTVCLSSTIRLNTVEPCRVRGNIIDRCEVDVFAPQSVQVVKLVECQGSWIAVYEIEVDLWLGVSELGSNIAWEVCLARVQPDERSCNTLGLHRRLQIWLRTISRDIVWDCSRLTFFKQWERIPLGGCIE